MWRSLCVATLVAALVSHVGGHGRVTSPAGRATAWRYGFPTRHNYDDDGVNCGGFNTQWSLNGGRCGICGDAYNLKSPRPHEFGGTYGDGFIVAQYQPGSTVAFTVDLTASHLGFWEFKLCPDPQSNEQECFDQYPLELETGGTKYYPIRGSTKYTVNYKLPPGLVCDHCVVQWRYTAGNNWGVCADGSGALGCGRQEQFGACSDIAIGTSRQNLVDGYEEIPSPLLFYLRNGYFDAQQGKNVENRIDEESEAVSHVDNEDDGVDSNIEKINVLDTGVDNEN